MVWGGRREEGSGWGTHVYLWGIHFDIWQNQYNTVKFKNKIKLKKKKAQHLENEDYGIQSHHFMENRQGNSERPFLGSKITADGDCSHEIKICLILGRRATTNLDSILNNRYITLSTKVHLVKAMFFPADMYGCESWTIRNRCVGEGS